MTNIEIMKRTEELEEKIAELRQAEREMTKIRYGTCKHDFIAITYRHPVNAFTGRCIFCDLHFEDGPTTDSYIRKGSKIVDVSKMYDRNVDPATTVAALKKAYVELVEKGEEPDVEKLIKTLEP